MREHAEHPIEADAADADHGDEGGRERDTKAAQVAGHVFVEHAKGVRREDRTHADIADRDDVGIAVEQRQDLAPQADNNDDRGERDDTASTRQTLSVLVQRSIWRAPWFCPTKVVHAWLKLLSRL